MLLNLSAKDFILIESLNIEFMDGLHTISGETGAGKSLLIDAILFALGEKFDSSVIRAGAESAVVVVEFTISEELSANLQEHGIDSSGTILIKRQQLAGNRKKFFINDISVTQNLVASIANELVEVHGQHCYSSLLSQAEHLKILDNFGNLILEKNTISQKFSQYQALLRDKESIDQKKDLILKDIDYLSFIVDELQMKCPNENEEQELEEQRSSLQHGEKKKNTIVELERIISQANIGGCVSSMQRVIGRAQGFDGVLQNLEQIEIYFKELEQSIHQLKQKDYETLDLDSVETRLFEIRGLVRKYNMPSNELRRYLEESTSKLNDLESKILGAEYIETELSAAREQYLALAKDLSAKRIAAAATLENIVQVELAPLKMEHCRFVVDVKSEEEGVMTSNGLDNVRFLAATNLGGALAPIDKVASGGELARLMLGIKLALFDKSYKPLAIIFDEIDTGIGGATADAIGERLLELGKRTQTIVITHQPQVAAKADHNILVVKESKNGQTTSTARILNEQEKAAEVARMISGASVTEASIAAAVELIKS